MNYSLQDPGEEKRTKRAVSVEKYPHRPHPSPHLATQNLRAKIERKEKQCFRSREWGHCYDHSPRSQSSLKRGETTERKKKD